MKISPTHEYSKAALEVVQKVMMNKKDEFRKVFKETDSLTFDYISDGVIAIRVPADKSKLTLSAKAFFAKETLIVVRTKANKLTIGPKSYPISSHIQKSDEFKKLAESTKKSI